MSRLAGAEREQRIEDLLPKRKRGLAERVRSVSIPESSHLDQMKQTNFEKKFVCFFLFSSKL